MRTLSVVSCAALITACAPLLPRFPEDVQTALAHDDMRTLETERFVIHYPASRRAVVDRFLARADRCLVALRRSSLLHGAERKLEIVMPDAPFNNAFVAPGVAGQGDIAVIPTYTTLDFTTSFGLPPDPGFVACHELAHYVQLQQLGGPWKRIREVLGPIYTPHVGYDAWVFEGLATHYEAQLLPGAGRPAWPLFTGMFAAAYAGEHVGGGELSSFGRRAPVGQHYLVGTMFVRFLVERYGERALWKAIAHQGSSTIGWLPAGSFRAGFGVSLGDLLDQFATWVARTYPVRHRPATQRVLAALGNEARYARGRDGTEAWVAVDLDRPPRLVIRDARGATLLDRGLVEVAPGRTLVHGDPLLVSGLSLTADGREVWVTVVDQGAIYQVPRLLRWRRGEAGLVEVRRDLGPGGSIDPAGRSYYYSHVDGDRWSLAAWDVDTARPRTVLAMVPGTYVVGAQVSPDGTRVAASVWDGTQFAIWVVDARTGAVVRQIADARGPVYDASFTSDGRLMWLAPVDGRFQIVVEGAQVGDAPYAALHAREAGGTIRFLDREGWRWELAEVALPPVGAAAIDPSVTAARTARAPTLAVSVISDRAYSAGRRVFVPELRAPTLVATTSGNSLVGVVLGGGDPLGFHRWSLAGYWQPRDPALGSRHHFGGSVGYMNRQLAPLSIVATAQVLETATEVEVDPDDDTTHVDERRELDAVVAIGRSWREAFSIALGGVYTEQRSRVDAGAVDRRRLGGPELAVTWSSAESTRYTGPRRALVVTGTAAYYPDALSSFAGDVTDLGGTLGLVAPLPLGRRHTFWAIARGRALVADEDGLLQLGGASAFATLWDRASGRTMAGAFDATRFPANRRFVEPLRGYEDFAVTTDRVVIGELGWRYPIIVDRGAAAPLGLPSLYLRQLDLELFGTGASDARGDAHCAVGGAVSLRLGILRVPFLLRYQLARRLVDDRALAQLVGLAVGL